MRLVICEGQQLLGDSLATALMEKGHYVLATTTTVAAGVAAVTVHRPDVFVLDLVCPGEQNGLDAARAICLHYPKTKVLLISGTLDPRRLAEASQVGVAGFLSKAKDVEEIADALDAIAAGEVVFDAGITEMGWHRQPQPARNPLDALSPREKEILTRIAEGHGTQVMARAMGITAGTVRMYVQAVLNKLGAHSRLEVAAMARRHAWLEALTSDDETFVSSPAAPDTAPISVLVVGGERTFADAVATRLEAEGDLTVLAAVPSAQLAQRAMAGRDVNVLLIDADLPDGAALSLCMDSSKQERPPLIIMLSASAKATHIAAAIRAGVAGWVRKAEPVEYLLRVIRGVVHGETWVPPAALGQVFQLLIQAQESPHDDGLLASLTAREREILSYMADGAGRKQIAERLHLSPHTVRSHMQSLMAKLGAHSALEAVTLLPAPPSDEPETYLGTAEAQGGVESGPSI